MRYDRIENMIGNILTTILRRSSVAFVATKLLPLAVVIGLTICVAQVQSQLLTGTPTESPSLPKHRTQKRTEATPPLESATSSSAADSPAASPTPKRIRRNTTVEMPA